MYEIPWKLIRRVAAGLLFLVLLKGSFYTVAQGERVVITRFGSIRTVAEPGLHMKLPLIDSATSIEVRTAAMEWKMWRIDEDKPETRDSRMESYSKDQQPAHIGVKITYRLKADTASVSEIYSQYRERMGLESNVLMPRAFEAVKVVFGQFTAMGVIQNRAHFNAQVAETYRSLVADAPAVIEGVQIQDISFSKVYEQAVEARMQAEVAVAKVTQDLERERKLAAIKVVQAEAEAQSVRLSGEAMAASIRARSAALRESPKLVELTLAEKWNGVLPTTMVPGGSVPFLGLGK